MSRIKDILEGWGNLVFRPEHNSPMVERRLLTCDKCPVRTGILCDSAKGGCGCVIPAKARARDAECPKNKWL
jgi:hypothetical protein